MKQHFLLLPALMVALSLSTGCQVTEYSTGPNGVDTFKRTAVGTKTSFADLTVKVSTNGTREIRLKGYQNDQVEALGVVAEKTAEGFARGLKP